MKKGILFLFLSLFLSLPSVLCQGQIIADHSVVSNYKDIPQEYIDKVKRMWLVYAGESHSYAIREGAILLEKLDSKYQANVTSSGTPESFTDKHLRVSRATWGNFLNPSGWIYDYGEEDWFTNDTAVSRTKAGIAYCHKNDLTISAIGFGWCYDMAYGDLKSNSPDPVFGCYWYGVTREGPNGNRSWGLDDEDNALTGNSVNMKTYLQATQQYIAYCKDNNIPTTVFFTTGTADTSYSDFSDERGYQAHLKNEYIRNYVRADTSLILFDYSDILCYDDNGNMASRSWANNTYPSITAINLGTRGIGHIGENGALRLAKAMWWMLARVAGWDGSTVPVQSILVSGEGGSALIDTYKGTLQLSAEVLPVNASNKSITWSVSNGSDCATVSGTGLLTALSDGSVTVIAEATDGSGISGEYTVTISNQRIPVEAINISFPGNSYIINLGDGPVQISAQVMPDTASVREVIWSVVNYTGEATISATGLLTPLTEGRITVQAFSTDGSGVAGYRNFIIENSTSSANIPLKEIMVIQLNGKHLKIQLNEIFLYHRIILYDLNGRLVDEMIAQGNYSFFDISNLNAGIYFVVLETEEGARTQKFAIP